MAKKPVGRKAKRARAENQAKAEAKLSPALIDVMKEFDLTTAEVCAVLSATLSRWTNYLVRDEREDKAPSV